MLSPFFHYGTSLLSFFVLIIQASNLEVLFEMNLINLGWKFIAWIRLSVWTSRGKIISSFNLFYLIIIRYSSFLYSLLSSSSLKLSSQKLQVYLSYDERNWKLESFGLGYPESRFSLLSLESFSSVLHFNILCFFGSVLFFYVLTQLWCEQAILDNSELSSYVGF